MTSAYGEMRAPLTTADAPFFMLRGLELQLAGRFDSTATTLPDNGLPGSPSNDRLVTLRRNAPVATIGARIFPLPELMLRASMATGALPPTISQLQQEGSTVSVAPEVPGFPQIQIVGADPKRGNRIVGSEQPFTLLTNGSPPGGVRARAHPGDRRGARPVAAWRSAAVGGLFAHHHARRDHQLSP